MAEGFVYILSSANSPFVKIGGTEFPPAFRLRSLNSGSAYEDHGPWLASDFRHVTDWRAVERILHSRNEDRRVTTVAGTRELFDLPVSDARNHLEQIDPAYLVGKDEVDRLFHDRALALYLERIFRFAALETWLDTQGSWTLKLFPKTGRGRYFTINIGRHEVAFATLPRDGTPELGSSLTSCYLNFLRPLAGLIITKGTQKNRLTKRLEIAHWRLDFSPA